MGLVAELDSKDADGNPRYPEGGPSAKQIIVDLHSRRLIGERQMRGIAQAYEALRTRGVKEPLRNVLREFDAGRLTVAGETLAAKFLPTLDDIPAELAEHANAKQKIAWLLESGSLSPAQASRASQALNLMKPPHTRENIIAALLHADALHAVPSDARTPEWGADPESEFLNTTAKIVAERLQTVPAVEFLDILAAREKEHPSYKGGRASVLEHIEARRAELEKEGPVPPESEPQGEDTGTTEPRPEGPEDDIDRVLGDS